MTLVLDPGDGYVDLVITDAPDVIDVVRATSGGLRETVRGGDQAETSGGALLLRDNEVPHNMTVGYEVQDAATGAAVDSQSILIQAQSAYLKVPGNADIQLATWLTDAAPEWESKARAGTFEPIGSPFPVVVSDTRSAPSMTIEIYTETLEQERRFLDVVKSVILFEPAADDVHRDRGYYHVGDVKKAVQVTQSRGTVWRLPLQRVLTPTLDYRHAIGAWELIAERWDTWQDLVNEGYTSWLDLIRDL